MVSFWFRVIKFWTLELEQTSFPRVASLSLEQEHLNKPFSLKLPPSFLSTNTQRLSLLHYDVRQRLPCQCKLNDGTSLRHTIYLVGSGTRTQSTLSGLSSFSLWLDCNLKHTLHSFLSYSTFYLVALFNLFIHLFFQEIIRLFGTCSYLQLKKRSQHNRYLILPIEIMCIWDCLALAFYFFLWRLCFEIICSWLDYSFFLLVFFLCILCSKD